MLPFAVSDKGLGEVRDELVTEGTLDELYCIGFLHPPDFKNAAPGDGAAVLAIWAARHDS